MIVLSIDPGYGRCGVAVLSGSPGSEELRFSECIETDSDDDFFDRLSQIGGRVKELVAEYDPDALAIEKLYFNSNQTTAMQVSQVRGMIAYIGKEAGLDVYEYTPLEIKNAVTGYGKSSKRQVITMTEQLISIDKEIKRDDEYDAIACGLTCIATESGRQG